MHDAPEVVPPSVPATRRPAIDLVRAGALALVVGGHLSLAVIDRGPEGELRGANLLGLHPRLAWLAVLSPMPLFFCAAGWANATATLHTAAPRLRSVVGLGAVVVTLWSSAAIIELLIRGEGDLLADGARIATQPMWFLAAYVPFTVLGARLTRIASRPVFAVGTCVAILTVLDIARFAFDAPSVLGWAGFFVAWCTPWLMGAWWRGAWSAGRFDERRTGLLIAAVSVPTAVLLLQFGGYHPELIDAVEGHRSNTTPPTLYTAVAGLAQVGALMMVTATLDLVAVRYRRVLDRAGQAAVGVYAWHLTALALCAALLAAGAWTPQRFTRAWWLSRPLWYGAVLGVTGLLVAGTQSGRRRLQGRQGIGAPRRATRATLVAGTAASIVGAAIVGLVGPRELPGAISGAVALIAGWWLLGRARSGLAPQASQAGL